MAIAKLRSIDVMLWYKKRNSIRTHPYKLDNQFAATFIHDKKFGGSLSH